MGTIFLLDHFAVTIPDKVYFLAFLLDNIPQSVYNVANHSGRTNMNTIAEFIKRTKKKPDLRRRSLPCVLGSGFALYAISSKIKKQFEWIKSTSR